MEYLYLHLNFFNLPEGLLLSFNQHDKFIIGDKTVYYLYMIISKIYIDVLYIDVYFVSLDGYFRMATPFRPYGVALCHKGCSHRRQRV